MPPSALQQHIVHIRQPIVRYDDAHPAALNPPAVQVPNARDRGKAPVDPTLPNVHNRTRPQLCGAANVVSTP